MHLFIHMVERALLAITRYNIFWQVITCYNYICRCSYICYTEALQKVPFFFFCYINGRLYTQRVLKTRAHPHGEAIHANRPRDHWHFKRYFRFISWYNWLTGQSSYLFFYLSKNTAWILIKLVFSFPASLFSATQHSTVWRITKFWQLSRFFWSIVDYTLEVLQRLDHQKTKQKKYPKKSLNTLETCVAAIPQEVSSQVHT